MTRKRRAQPGEKLDFLIRHIDYEGDDCVLWPFFALRTRHGFLEARTSYEGRTVPAGRVMCELVHGKPPKEDSLAVRSCGNGLCVNPKHLSWGNILKVKAGQMERGTQLKGEDQYRVTLTEDDIREIRRTFDKKKNTYTEFAEKYGIHKNTIAGIIRGRTWKHVK